MASMDDQRNDASRDDMKRVIGLSRRDLLKRGAIVAGTLAWAVPAVQSVAPAAYAASESGVCATCYCYRVNAAGATLSDLCITDGPFGLLASAADCDAFCRSQFDGAGKHYNRSTYCQGTSCQCNSKTANNPTPYGVACS
jgi:hypothetical protein